LCKDKSIKVLRDLELIVSIVDLSGKIVQLAFNEEVFTDFEDGLQHHSAIEIGAGVIITRNLKGFKYSSLPVLTAAQSVKAIGK
jgi:hypothetical protein